MSELRRLPVLPTAVSLAADALNTATADKVTSHEDAAHEKRNWVRLSYDCNNHCTFCLDSDAHDGTMRATDEIKVQIVEGRRRGAERLILSGGEPTMHPNFLDFVKLGRRAGYRKVQTVTNGRMFAYPGFLERAADNGLDEITFSLHGHTARLHDALVGTPGAFAEETKGLRAALDSGRFIVNLDIVINKQNFRHLPEMMETFYGWGVREFDLLHIIPFGNAWSLARDHLFYDLDEALPFLQQAFAWARRPDVHVWLNRFPPPFAEGFEDLIQDPHKLNDEVRGRREEFDRYLALGKPLHCRQPDRCKRCYVQPLCDGLDQVMSERARPEVDVLRLASEVGRKGVLPAATVARIVAPDVSRALAIARSVACRGYELELGTFDGLLGALDPDGSLLGRPLERCVVATVEDAERLLAGPGAFEVQVVLTQATEGFVRSLQAPPARLTLLQPAWSRVTDARGRDVDLRAFFQGWPHVLPVEGAPACLVGRERARPARVVLDGEMLGPDGRVEMGAYTHRFVAERFRTKSLRCRACAEDAACAGVHVNWVRAHGYAPLSPLEPPSPLGP